MPVRSEKDLREEARRLRERGKSLSGFWISELAAAAYALEWAIGKKDKPPSDDVGSVGSGHGKIAETMTKAAEKTRPLAVKPKPAAVKPKTAPAKPEKTPVRSRKAR
jgi:hypothetical protein